MNPSSRKTIYIERHYDQVFTLWKDARTTHRKHSECITKFTFEEPSLSISIHLRRKARVATLITGSNAVWITNVCTSNMKINMTKGEFRLRAKIRQSYSIKIYFWTFHCLYAGHDLSRKNDLARTFHGL